MFGMVRTTNRCFILLKNVQRTKDKCVLFEAESSYKNALNVFNMAYVTARLIISAPVPKLFTVRKMKAASIQTRPGLCWNWEEEMCDLHDESAYYGIIRVCL